MSPELLKNREEEPKITFYLEDSEEGLHLLRQVRQQAMMLKSREYEGFFPENMTLGRLYVEARMVDDEDWKDRWKEYFKPVRITERLVIKPSWESFEDRQEGDVIIELDPGMAFGTGTHETTWLCLELMEKYLKPGDAVLDVGCGSGVLSVAAGLLGAERVLAVDLDPEAVGVTKENAAKNGLSKIIEAVPGDLTRDVDFRADLTVANLMADLVIRLGETVGKNLKGEGVLIASGILCQRRDEVTAALESRGFEILSVPEKGEWCAVAARPGAGFSHKKER